MSASTPRTNLAAPGVLAAVVALAACGDDRYVLVEAQPAQLLLADPARWAVETGTVEFAVPGTFTYARSYALRFGIESVVNHDLTAIETRNGVLTARETRTGTSCFVSVLPVCTGTRCEAEVALLGDGDCMIRIRATAADGERRGACWYRGQFTIADPASSPEIEIIEARVADEYQACLDSL